MSRTNCLRPSRGFCLNLRVRMVNSGMARQGVDRDGRSHKHRWASCLGLYTL